MSIPQGWQCPKCLAIHAPFIPMCIACQRESNAKKLPYGAGSASKIVGDVGWPDKLPYAPSVESVLLGDKIERSPGITVLDNDDDAAMHNAREIAKDPVVFANHFAELTKPEDAPNAGWPLGPDTCMCAICIAKRDQQELLGAPPPYK